MKARPNVSLRNALTNPDLLGHVMAGDSWRPQRILSIAAMGEELTDDERVVFRQFTGREHEPLQPVREFCTIGGRRTGKTVTMGMRATYLSACCDYSDVLIRGETGVCLCLAQDQRVATQLLNFVEENLRGSPVLSQLIAGRTSDAIELKNNIRIEVRPVSYRKLRGPTYIAILCDELSFWYTDDGYVNPDVEVIAAARPGMMTTGGMLITASSPYAKRGMLWDTYAKHYGPAGDPLVLVAKGTTREFNPTIPQEEIDRELERDPVKNRAEYLAEFRNDIESYLSIEAVQNCIQPHVFERAPQLNTKYYGFADPAGGGDGPGADSFAAGVAHYDYAKKALIVDALREVRPRFSPELATIELCKVFASYHVDTIQGDDYARAYPVEQFARCGVRYEKCEKHKHELYADLEPLINSRRIELLDHPKLVSQLISLERRGGKVAHPPGAHDDIANVVAGLAQVVFLIGGWDTSYAWANGRASDEETPEEAWQRMRRNFYYESGGQIKLW